MTLHSVFGAAPPPGTWAYYSDAPPWIHLGTAFYGISLPAGSQIVGARQWIPAGTGGGTLTFELRLVVKDGQNDLLTPAVQTKSVTWSGDGKWVEATFNVPQDVPASSYRWMVSYRMALDGRYISSLDARPSPGSAIKSATTDLYLSEYLYPTAPQGSVHGRQFTIGGDPIVFAATDTGGYGTDTIVSTPDGPANQAPTANAGSDQVLTLGANVTLTGSGSDTDGTVASVLWSQISGPSVTLLGSGLSRTFTPTSAGNYVFALVVTDNDGASSAPDTVTVHVIEIPDEEPASTLELAVNRKQTVQFIKANPSAVTFKRGTRVSNGKGGYTTTWADLPPQEVRIVMISQGNIASRNIDGEEIQPAFVIIGRWNADIKDGDTFTYEGRDYSVMYVRGAGQSTAYETWAEVRYVG